MVNVVTKTGSNKFKGSIFGTVRPGLLTAPAQTTPINASSIDATAHNAYVADLYAPAFGRLGARLTF